MRVFNKTCEPRLGTPWDYVEVLAVIAVVTVGGWFTPLNYHAFGYIYLLAVIALSLRLSRWPVLVGAVVSGVAWNFVFVPPRLSFSILHFDDYLLLATYFIVALVGSQLAMLRTADQRAKLLAESERLHQTLLDGVAHELKTPIAVFRSAVDQLSAADPVRREGLITEIRQAVQRLDSLVANLLNQTRLESGMLKPQLDWCDARELVVAARRATGSRIDTHVLAIDIPPDFPLLMADAALMEQSIGHLLHNAAVHTPAMGRIWVTAGTADDPDVTTLTVADEGPGISASLRDRIFDKFSRGPSARAGGLGLGLSIVRGFMEAQGGEVSFEPRSEGGSRFILSLPRVMAEPVPHG
jgi:K+-sensing histidine kinase KdpD